MRTGCSFLKIKKNGTVLEKKALICVYLFVKFFVQNVASRASKKATPTCLPAGLFCVFDEKFTEVL